MSREILKKIKKRAKRLQEILETLPNYREMVRGAFCTVYVKCGKKYCHCEKGGKLHAHKRMAWRENNQQYNRAVPPENHAWVTKINQDYREFKKLRNELKNINKEIGQLLDVYEDAVVEKTRKDKSYLGTKTPKKLRFSKKSQTEEIKLTS